MRDMRGTQTALLIGLSGAELARLPGLVIRRDTSVGAASVPVVRPLRAASLFHDSNEWAREAVVGDLGACRAGSGREQRV
jgi:hypothetical protein